LVCVILDVSCDSFFIISFIFPSPYAADREKPMCFTPPSFFRPEPARDLYLIFSRFPHSFLPPWFFFFRYRSFLNGLVPCSFTYQLAGRTVFENFRFFSTPSFLSLLDSVVWLIFYSSLHPATPNFLIPLPPLLIFRGEVPTPKPICLKLTPRPPPLSFQGV